MVFTDFYGNPFGRVWHSKLGSTTLIRRRQLEIYNTNEGLKLIKEWSIRKIENQMQFLKDLKKTRPKMAETFNTATERLKKRIEGLKELKGTIEKNRYKILGIEGECARIYFGILSQAVPEKFRFEGRSRNPAKDYFNTMLNYGYGILYSMVEKSCIIAGLDPYIGLLHTDNYNKESFVFDFIENYRIFVDRTVLFLFTKKMVNENMFDKIEGGFFLNKEGKKLLIGEFNKTFDNTIKYHGRNIKIRDTITFDAHKIANSLIKSVK